MKKNSPEPISSYTVIDNKFGDLYSGGIPHFAGDILKHLSLDRKVYPVSITGMFNDWKIAKLLPRKIVILLYDCIYFPWKIKNIKYINEIILPYHDCIVPKKYHIFTKIFVHDDSILASNGSSATDFLIVNYYRFRLSKQLKYSGAKFFTISKTSKEKLEARFGITFKVCYSTIPSEFYSFFETSKFSSVDNVVKFLYSGGFHFRKNFAFAISCIVSYARSCSKRIEITITGSPPNDFRSNFNLNLPSNLTVVWAGIVDHDKLLLLYRESHINLYPTDVEGFGRIIPESCLSLCHVISQNLDVLKEVALDSKYHHTVDSLCEAKFISKIKMIVNSDLGAFKLLNNGAELERFKLFQKIVLEN